ncbi:type IV pilin accessory protein [Acinetobacter sp. WCHAc060033]|uniref:TfpX/TfpZ family type IV pilin accessory protein n=1 Tax=Acinetobacter sp. WCHAc060033 TaxID=2518624 RepID=UPI0010236C4D|nr:TfpX/TfpZ family type IV pilin accessory protein [Acinetobacter sp. WCHAc060033]RZG88400.1 type IV pilin accessory protein [Acinetobacter sp. WCHAc060033]
MMNSLSKRKKFFLGHLGISCVSALIILVWVFFVWYPSPLANAVGVTQIFLMMLAIDVIVGPVLGFIVYKEGKKSLKMDLGVIIALQISALCYGIYSIEQGRPAWIAFNVDRFELVRKNEIIEDHIAEALPEYQHVSWLKPQFIAVEFAKDVKVRNEDMFAEVLGGISLSQKPERYIALSNAQKQMSDRAQNLSGLNLFNSKQDVDNIIKKYSQANAWLPLKANAEDMVVLINKEKGQVIKIVDLRPWK